jgi:hypothetical protein
MDFVTSLLSGVQLDMWMIALLFVVIVSVPILYFVYQRFASSKSTMEESSAPSIDHFQAQQEEDQPTATLPDESSSEHLAPNQDTPE